MFLNGSLWKLINIKYKPRTSSPLDDEDAEVPPIGDANNLNDESTRVTTIIELEAVTKEDAGKYLCIAQNSLGEASEAAWLTIEGIMCSCL